MERQQLMLSTVRYPSSPGSNARSSQHLKSDNPASKPIPLENTLFYFYSFFDLLALCYLPVLLLFDDVCGGLFHGERVPRFTQKKLNECVN